MVEQNKGRKKIISSLFWKVMERGGTQVVQFVISIILARLLSPDDYGLLALILVFIEFANVFVESGFGTALVQKKDSDNVDFSSILFLNLFVALIIYGILFLLSPVVAKFYSRPVLSSLMRVVSLTIFPGAVNNIQNAYIAKKFLFKCNFYSSLIAVLVSGVVGIICAYNGFGVWALVIQQLVSVSLICIVLWFTVRWRPKIQFSLARVKQLFIFGSNLLISNIIAKIFTNIYTLIIGKLYSQKMLGLYKRGLQFPQLITGNIVSSISAVMLPAMSEKNDDVEAVKKITRRFISVSSFILIPCLFGMAAISDVLVPLLLTDKWNGCIVFLKIACVGHICYCLHNANLIPINALGRSDVYLKLEIIKKIIDAIVIISSLPFGIYGLAVGSTINEFIHLFINAYPNKRILKYSILEQIKDILPYTISSFVMAVIIFPMKFIPIPLIMILILQISFGIIFYLSIAKMFKLDSFLYLMDIIQKNKQ